MGAVGPSWPHLDAPTGLPPCSGHHGHPPKALPGKATKADLEGPRGLDVRGVPSYVPMGEYPV